MQISRAQQPEKARGQLPVRGQLGISTQHSTNPGNDYLLQPPDYVRLRGGLQTSLAALPVQLGGLATTEQGAYRQAISQFSLGLDVQSLQEKVLSRAEQKAKQKQQELAYMHKLDSATYNNKAYNKMQWAQSLYEGYPELAAYENELANLDKLPKDAEPAQRLMAEALERNHALQHWYTEQLDTLNKNARTLGQLQKGRAYADSLRALQAQAKAYTLQANALSKRVPEAANLYDLPELPTDSLQARQTRAEHELEQLKQVQQKPQQAFANKKRLVEMGLLEKSEQKLFVIKKLQLGTSYPYYADLAFKGAAILGLDVELEPGEWHVQASAAHNQNASQAISLSNLNSLYQLRLPALYTRNIVAASVGRGPQEGTHLHLNLLYGTDRQGQAPDTLFPENTPRRNYLIGLDFALPLLGESLSLRGEFHKSLTYRDLNTYRPQAGEVPGWVGQLYAYSDTLAQDYALQLALAYALDKHTQLEARYRRLGPGYTSFGVPFLRNDLRAYALLAKRQYPHLHLEVRGLAEYEQTNLKGLKPYGVNTTSLGAGATWSPPKAPTLSADYQLARQQGVSQVVKTESQDSIPPAGDFHLLSLTAAYAYGKKNPQAISLSASHQLRTAQQTFYDATAPAFPSIRLYSLSSAYRLQLGKWTLTTQANLVWESSNRSLNQGETGTSSEQDFVLPPQRLYAGTAALASTHLRWLRIEGGAALARDESLGTRTSPFLTLGTTLLKKINLSATTAYNLLTQNHLPTETYWQFNTELSYTL
ncbi:MAG: hypothetical protein LW884_06025 [Bacteroidetes bacterium]|nr:hypothetical protein [Bacteroidota bacterium]